MMYARSCGSPSCSKWWFYCHRVTIIYLWEVVQQYLWLSDYFSKCCDFGLIFGSISCDFIASYVDMLLQLFAGSAGCVSPRLRPLVPPPSDLSWEQFSEPTFLYLTETPTTPPPPLSTDCLAVSVAFAASPPRWVSFEYWNRGLLNKGVV